MKAIVQGVYGSPHVLELREVDKPPVGDDEALIRVRAASLNPADWHVMRGRPFVVRLSGYGLRKPKKSILGTDMAGVVEVVGKNVTRLRPGDEVFGWCRGACAEYGCAPEDHFVAKPANVTFEQAAAIPIAATTALQGLRDLGQLQRGQTILVIGASGGVGTFAVQIGKALGAEVTGVCSTRNVDMVRAIGADRVIDYTHGDPLPGERRYDLIFQLAGTSSPSECRHALTPKGTLVLSSGDGRLSGIDRIIRAMVSTWFVSQRLVTRVASLNTADLVTLAGFVEAGQVKPIIDRTYALSETAAAIGYLEAGHARGKVVISV